MRRNTYNIIRECNRDRQRYSAAAFDELMEQGAATEAGPAAVIAQAIASVLQALEALSPGDRNLIQWKVVEGLT